MTVSVRAPGAAGTASVLRVGGLRRPVVRVWPACHSPCRACGARLRASVAAGRARRARGGRPHPGRRHRLGSHRTRSQHRLADSLASRGAGPVGRGSLEHRWSLVPGCVPQPTGRPLPVGCRRRGRARRHVGARIRSRRWHRRFRCHPDGCFRWRPVGGRVHLCLGWCCGSGWGHGDVIAGRDRDRQLPSRRSRPSCNNAKARPCARCTHGSSAASPPLGGPKCSCCCRTQR